MTSFSLPIVPRYAEVDQQGVVFNSHYLTWFDEACTGFLDHLDVTYPGLIAGGHDIQVVHSEVTSWARSGGATPCASRSIATESDPPASRSVQRAARRRRRPDAESRPRCAATMYTSWSPPTTGPNARTSGVAEALTSVRVEPLTRPIEAWRVRQPMGHDHDHRRELRRGWSNS